MPEQLVFYVSGSSATEASVPARALEHKFAWRTASAAARQPDPYISPQLAQEIREALAAVERGEIEDLGDFSQYVDDED